MNDVNGYIERMNKSIDYKTFWFDKVDINKFDRIIDFGCGDGELGLKALKYDRFKDKEVVFYEVSPEIKAKLVQKLKAAGEEYQDRITVLSSFELLEPLLHNERTLIVFSSVLHECYTFNTLPFKWKDLCCNYIVIRDMYGDDLRVYFTKKERRKIFWHSRKKAFFDFFTRYGFSDKSYLHFLMKHLYKENWNTEVLEDYFAVPWDYIEDELVVCGRYTFAHIKRYNIPFLINNSKETFGVEYDFYTHRDAIYVRRNND